MGFFNWAAPIFGHYADRWTDDDIRLISGWLTPFVGPGGSLLDVGGGTGALARRLHEALSAEVTVLDPTPEMVRYIPAEGPVRVVLGEAESMPFPDDSFDALIVSDAFHHFREQPRAVDEFARVVRPGGGILVLELDPHGFSMRIVAGVERLLGEPAAFLPPDELRELMSTRGVLGSCSPSVRGSYRFVGEVQTTKDSAQPFQR